jgi:hypothetical protein
MLPRSVNVRAVELASQHSYRPDAQLGLASENPNDVRAPGNPCVVSPDTRACVSGSPCPSRPAP